MNQLKSITLVSSLSFVALATFVGATPGVVADFTSTSAVDSNQVSAGTVQVEIVDSNGGVRTTPFFSVINAAPEMLAQTSTILIKNNGSLAASLRFTATDLMNATSADLNEVLRVVIKDSDNQILYTGAIADLSIEVGNLAASETLTWQMTIDWPDLANVDDNPYQASAISFALQVDASNLVS